MIGLGITLMKKKVSFKRFKIRVTTEKKSIDGNIYGDIGIEVTAAYQFLPFPPYTGCGFKIGTYETCHALQGTAHFTGKDLTAQLVKGSEVKNEAILVSSLFDVPIGMACLIKQQC